MIRQAAFGLMALMLAGCATDPEDRDRAAGLTGVVVGALGGRLAAAPAANPMPPEQVQQVLASYPQPILWLRVEATGQEALLLGVARQGGTDTYQSATGQTFGFRDGRLVATRGLNFDLMSAEGSAPRPGTAPHTRVTLDGTDTEVIDRGRCTLVAGGSAPVALADGRRPSLSQLDETCDYPRAGTVGQHYWRDAQGRVIQSRQWVGPETGMLTFQSLRPWP